jgi:hypothetical protein
MSLSDYYILMMKILKSVHYQVMFFSFKTPSTFLDAQILAKFHQLPSKSRIWHHAWTLPHYMQETVLETALEPVHHVGDQDRYRPRNASSTVDQHIALLPLLVYEPDARVEHMTDLLLLVVPQF